MHSSEEKPCLRIPCGGPPIRPQPGFWGGEGGVAVDFCTKKHMRKGRAGSIEHGQFWHRIADREIRMIPSRCSRNHSGQSTVEPFRATVFNIMAATHSIENSSFYSISTSFSRSSKLVRDQRVGGSTPLSSTKHCGFDLLPAN